MVNAQPSAMVDAMSASIPELYARQDAMTDPGMFAGLYEDLPADVSALRDVASQLILHVSWAERYGIPPDVPLPRDTQSVSDRLKLIRGRTPSSQTHVRHVPRLFIDALQHAQTTLNRGAY